MAKVSLGVPVYNGARFLATSLESLVAQTFDDLEIFISDNGSTDETPEIARDFATRDARVAYFRSDANRGASWNYRNVVERTSGEYFKWATHDDLLAPTYLERCVEALDSASPDVALVYPRTLIIDEDGAVVREYEDRLDIRASTPHERLADLVRHIVMSNASFGLIRRSTLERTRLLDTFPSADYVMMFELAILGQFWELDEFLFMRREHPAMSRAANPSTAEAAEWFLPGSSKGRRYMVESWRLFVEHLRSIHRLPLDSRERLRCYTTFLGAWARRWGPQMMTEPLGIAYTRGWKPFRSAA